MAIRTAVAIAREIQQIKAAPISAEAKESLVSDLKEELEGLARDAARARKAQQDLLDSAKKGVK